MCFLQRGNCFPQVLIINDNFILVALCFNGQKRSLLNYVSVKLFWCLRLLFFYFLLKMLFQLVLSFKWTNLCKGRNNVCKCDITFGNKTNQIKGGKKGNSHLTRKVRIIKMTKDLCHFALGTWFMSNSLIIALQLLFHWYYYLVKITYYILSDSLVCVCALK